MSHPLKRSTLLLMSFATGATVANLYYNQPLLDQMRESLGGSVGQVGWIPTLTQVGYAGGMLFLVPLGDMLERRRLVVVFTFAAAAWCAVLASASTLNVAIVASFGLGISTMTPQLLVPFAAHLAEPSRRGQVVGTLMSGLLLGILLARTVSGFVGAAFGWRVMFGAVAVFLTVLAGTLAFVLPKSQPSFHGRYTDLLRSVVRIFSEQPVLREACLFGGMLFGAFSIFWATLIHLMQSPAFGLGSRAVGLYGLLGAAAAAVAPLVGRLADKRDARRTTGIVLVGTILSFGVFALSGRSLVGVGVGVLLMDIGVQSGHVSNQSRFFGLVPGAQSRLQTAYMFCYFMGGAAGSLLGTWAWTAYGWNGVCAMAVLMLSVALVRFILPAPSASPRSGDTTAASNPT